MASLFEVIVYSTLGGVVSLVGGILLLSNKKRAHILAEYATPFAAGALLSAAFMDLLTEAAHEGDIERALKSALFGIVFFFLLERFLRWFHHHHEHEEGNKSDPNVSLIIIGDTIHNFIDGIAIGAAFLVDVNTGIIASLAVAAHEIPQEIGDFGILLHKGVSRRNVLLVNVFSALATIIAASVFFTIGNQSLLPLDIVLGIVAGFFIYIATSDIIPTIHENDSRNAANLQTVMLLLGVIIVGIATTQLHGLIEQTQEGASMIESHDEHEH